jgi:glycosyltransferase involved in cell wall biosynthesis
MANVSNPSHQLNMAPVSQPTVAALVIAKNEETMIVNCLDTLRWCSTIIVIDSGSADRTVDLAKQAGAQVIPAKGRSFADWRNEAAQATTADWLLYVDADERVTPDLAKSLQSRAQRPDFDAYYLRRNNIHYGKWLQHGGWQQDKLLRFIRRTNLKTWQGDVHEHAEIIGRTGDMQEPLVHLTHRNLFDGLQKSIVWTDIEAHLLLDAHHKKVGPLRLIKIVLFDLVKRVFFQVAWKDGAEGMLEAMVQSMNRFLVYARLWELQQKPSLPERYERIEKAIQEQWRQTSRH